MPRPQRLIQTMARQNEMYTCTVPGCQDHRTGMRRMCRDHLRTDRRYGHPNGNPLKPSTFARERALVVDLLSKNTDHAALTHGLRWLTAWCTEATTSERAFAGADEVARLIRHGVTPLAILAEVAAVDIWLNNNPRALPDDRAEDFAVSRAVFMLAPRPRRQSGWRPARPGGRAPEPWTYAPVPKPGALAFVGHHLRRRALTPLLVVIASAVQARAREEEAQRAAMRTPMQWAALPSGVSA